MSEKLPIKKAAPAAAPAPAPAAFKPSLFISGINTPVCVQLLINKPDFTLGKSENCDGILVFSDEISREHCKIIWRNGAYYAMDLNSTNSTCINGEELVPGREYPIQPGDQLRLSASIFLIEQIYSLSRR